MASLSLKHASRTYPGGVKAVGDFSLDVEDGEFVVIVGPSGCGKTSVLRMIAGLDRLTSGDLYIDGERMNDVEPKDRDIAMVFQNYALFPHMTVYDNLALGLKLRNVSEQTVKARVHEAAEMLGVTDLLGRKAAKLSGGEMQRVAIGRAIVRRPKVFLLDEPLSNLDAKLRVQMRMEIAKLHHKLGTTFVYVTHDQTEAMTMGERIVVMKDGYVRQIDTPTGLYDKPNDLFVACFLGSPQMNIFDARLVEEDGGLYALIGDRGRIAVPGSKIARINDKSIIGSAVKLGIRPEDIHYEQAFVDAYPESVIEGVVDVVESLGNENIVYLNVDGKDDYTVVRMDSRFMPVQGKRIKLCFSPERIHLFDPTTEKSLTSVPEYNRISGRAVAKDGKLCITSGDVSISLGDAMLDRITDNSVVNSEVTVGIPPSCLKIERGSCDCSVTGKSEFFERFTKTKALYMSVDGIAEYFIAVLPSDAEVTDGNALTLYFSSQDVVLYNKDGERVSTDVRIEGNVTECTVSAKSGKVVYTLYDESGKKIGKLQFPTDDRVSEITEKTRMYIDIRGMKTDAEAIRCNKFAVLKGIITHIDEYDGGAVVTAEIKGFKAPIVAVVSGNVCYSPGDAVKFAVEPAAVKIGKFRKLSEIVRESSK